MKGLTDMPRDGRWVEYTPGIPEIIGMSDEWATDSESGITVYWHALGVSAIRKTGETYWIYETDFREALDIDVTEILPGDVIWHCMEDGPVRSHRPHVEFDNVEMVFFESGIKDGFGKPQKIQVLRGGQFA